MQNICDGAALCAQLANGECIMPLGQSLIVLVGDERAVEPCGLRLRQCAQDESLAGGGLEQVGTANDFCDGEIGIVDCAGELVAGRAVAPPDEEVTEVDASGEALRAEILVEKFHNFAIGNTEAPILIAGIDVRNI